MEKYQPKKHEVAKASEIIIPHLMDVASWQSVEIQPSDESLLLINDLNISCRITVSGEYAKLGFKTASKSQYSRSGVIERLKKAVNFLPKNISFKIYDAWRPLPLQLEIFNKFLEELKITHKGASDQELIDLCKKFVSLPSSDPKHPSPHYSGGAIDLTLVNEFGSELWMGTGFDDFSKRAGTRYFEDEYNIQSDLDLEARKNRRLLFQAMTEAGFTNYLEEWWHFDFGNQFWGKVTGQKAIYGPVSIK
jgi:zinc D-Ala-D-Ala dipeptidase